MAHSKSRAAFLLSDCRGLEIQEGVPGAQRRVFTESERSSGRYKSGDHSALIGVKAMVAEVLRVPISRERLKEGRQTADSFMD